MMFSSKLGLGFRQGQKDFYEVFSMNFHLLGRFFTVFGSQGLLFPPKKGGGSLKSFDIS